MCSLSAHCLAPISLTYNNPPGRGLPTMRFAISGLLWFGEKKPSKNGKFSRPINASNPLLVLSCHSVPEIEITS